MIQFTCQFCRRGLQVDDSVAGALVPCPYCGKSVRARASAPPPTSPVRVAAAPPPAAPRSGGPVHVMLADAMDGLLRVVANLLPEARIEDALSVAERTAAWATLGWVALSVMVGIVATSVAGGTPMLGHHLWAAAGFLALYYALVRTAPAAASGIRNRTIAMPRVGVIKAIALLVVVWGLSPLLDWPIQAEEWTFWASLVSRLAGAVIAVAALLAPGIAGAAVAGDVGICQEARSLILYVSRTAVRLLPMSVGLWLIVGFAEAVVQLVKPLGEGIRTWHLLILRGQSAQAMAVVGAVPLGYVVLLIVGAILECWAPTPTPPPAPQA